MKEKKKKNTISEDEWRSYLLSYYQIEQKKSIKIYLEERDILSKRWSFDKRFKDSGLKEMKQCKAPYADAVAQYDKWIESWKACLSKKQKNNGRKAFGDVTEIRINSDNTNNKNDDQITNKGKNQNAEQEKDSQQDLNNDKDESNINQDCIQIDFATFDDEDTDESPDDTIDDVDTTNKKKRTRKLSGESLKLILSELYTSRSKPYTILREKQTVGNKNTVYRHWKASGLEEMKRDGVEFGTAMEKYDEWRRNFNENISERNRKNGSTEKAIPLELEAFMRELIKQLALCGQGVGKKVVAKVIEEAMREWGVSAFSRSTLDRFICNYELECRVLKNIDPARIAQVTPENRDAFFFRLNQVVALLHDMHPVHCPWTSWKEVDSAFIDNVDEMGSDNTKHRDVLLIPKEVTQRLFQSTPEGDKSNRHVSLAVFSKSNGWYKDNAAGIHGAPPPMIIHSKHQASSKGKNATAMEKRMELYNTQEDDDVLVDQSYLDGISPGNPIGFTIRTTANGSMTKEIFFDLVCHYVRHLGPNQGPEGKFTFLLTDSHVSRWHPKALYLLLKNRVVPLFFPSHLSIVCQPQDNGVILFLHKCIEETSLAERLFRTDTNVAYINRLLEKAFILFRDRERMKLMDRGSNSTTRSYRVTGMKPCDPFASGWRENLELYASFNGLRLERAACPYYGIRPKNRDVCPVFSEADVSLLDEAFPLLAKENADDITVLDDPKTKCYAVANEIIANWIDKPDDERAIRPRAITRAEKLALKHMDITHIIAAEAVSDESTLLLDSNFNDAKRRSILGLAKANECIQVRRKDEENSMSTWCTAIKMLHPDNMWHVFDGVESQPVSTLELDKEWDVNLSYDMFPSDKKLKESRWRSGRRRRDEKDRMIKQMAMTVAEEERNGELKHLFEEFMNRPRNKQNFFEFKESIVTRIEEPSEHAITVNFGSEEHTMKVSAHGNTMCPMSQLVMENICKTLVCLASRTEKKSAGRRRGGKVVSVKRGSDGFQKILQVDEQNQQDQIQQDRNHEKSKKAKLLLCQRRLKEVRKICLIRNYQRIWKSNDRLLSSDSKSLNKPTLISFLKVYNVEGRASLYNKPRTVIETKLNEMKINQNAFEQIEEDLLEELRLLGGVDTFDINQSFDSSFEFEEHSDHHPSSDEDNDHSIIVFDSETSCGDHSEDRSVGSDTDIGSESNNRKKVSFDEEPTFYQIPPRISPPQSQRRRRTRQQKFQPATPSNGSPKRAKAPTPAPSSTTTATTRITLPMRRNPSTRRRKCPQRLLD